MMKSAVVALFLLASLNSSQASTTQVQQASQFHKHSVLKNRTATKNALAYAALKKPQRKLLVINDLEDDENDNLPGPDELDLQSPYARPRVSEKRQELTSDDNISDYVAVRLAVARARALEKYREIYGS